MVVDFWDQGRLSEIATEVFENGATLGGTIFALNIIFNIILYNF